MITEYHRPSSVNEALQLLARPQPKTIPMGGGSGINRNLPENVAVVDLQDLQLADYVKEGDKFKLGATCTLQALVDWSGFPEQFIKIITQEFSLNTRNVATVAGVLVTATEKSRLATAMLATDCHMLWEPGQVEIAYGEWLALRKTWKEATLITGITFTFPKYLCFQQVTRTPMDIPIVGLCKSKWKSGRIRLALTGMGQPPSCVFDGNDESGLAEAAKNAYSHYSHNIGLQEYIHGVIDVLVNRCSGGGLP